MPNPYFVCGEAGAGKTHRLMAKVKNLSAERPFSEHQAVLAMSLMHGARQQLERALAQACPKVPTNVCTIHSFCLQVVNRWRRSLGISLPVTICDEPCGFETRHGFTFATFNQVMAAAQSLLTSPTVLRVLAEAHPIVVVDEFQDCDRNALKIVQALASATKVLLAGDDFQVLINVSDRCPALEWIRGLKSEGKVEFVELTGSPRFENAPVVLRAARALRNGVAASTPTVPVFYGFNPGHVISRIVYRFLGETNSTAVRRGTCAFLGLSTDHSEFREALDSFARQLAKKSPTRKVRWYSVPSEASRFEQIMTELQISPDAVPHCAWQQPATALSPLASKICDDSVYHSKLSGVSEVTNDLLKQTARMVVHSDRAFGRVRAQFQVLTIHAAKNREFDHVFVLWGYARKNKNWREEDLRRLLYNAVTRARIDCTILVLGNVSDVTDGVIGLLGGAQPAMTFRGRSTASKGTQNRKSRRPKTG